jgi:GAF domain-containing protein
VSKTIRMPESDEKRALYAHAEAKLRGLLDGERDPLVILASIAAVLHDTMPHHYWTGFYRVVGDELVIGPYQGTPACFRIPKGRGVCGTAWSRGETIVVEDVHAFPGHIACDSRSESEIVVPFRDARGGIVAVLDVDSTLKAAFDAVDQSALEGILGVFRSITPC